MPFSAVSGWNIDAITYLRDAPTKWNTSIPWAGRGRNFQAWELGWDVDRVDRPYLETQIAKMDRDFDLVMISNYYFESLVLLKDTLCMDWPDLYVPPTKVKDSVLNFVLFSNNSMILPTLYSTMNMRPSPIMIVKFSRSSSIKTH